MLWFSGLISIILLIVLYFRFNPQFGGRMNAALERSYQKSSSHWDGKVFVNQVPVDMEVGFKDLPGMLKKRFVSKVAREPEFPIPVKPFDSEAFNSNPGQPKFIWYGHAVLLLQLNRNNLLIDPIFGPSASPIAPFGVKRFSKKTLDIIDQLPPIDAVLISHDHYDHLDYASIKKIKSKVDTWFVAMGVSRHLERWGVSANQITEFDWWKAIDFDTIKITFTPSRHFSGRGLTDRFKSLWGGWVFQTKDHSIYWSGDGGYGDHFKTMNAKFGPFDWAFMECGQYNEMWHHLHLFPEESAQAAIDSGAKVAIPVHWGGFALAMHSWKEPVEKFVAKAEQEQLPVCTPEIGAVITLGTEPTTERWYAELK